jgi:hypothetical protein
MMIKIKKPKAMTQGTWEKKWEKIKLKAMMTVGDIRYAMGPTNQARNWDGILICMQNTNQLEKLILQ